MPTPSATEAKRDGAMQAGDIAVSFPTVTIADPVAKAVRMMAVVDADGVLVGTITLERLLTSLAVTGPGESPG